MDEDLQKQAHSYALDYLEKLNAEVRFTRVGTPKPETLNP